MVKKKNSHLSNVILMICYKAMVLLLPLAMMLTMVFIRLSMEDDLATFTVALLTAGILVQIYEHLLLEEFEYRRKFVGN